MTNGNFHNLHSFRILAAVTFHYRSTRLEYLFEVIRALSEYPVEVLDIVVVTNVDNEKQLSRIRALCEPLMEALPSRQSSRRSLSFESFTELSNPWFLPWAHKRLISDTFMGHDSHYTHFIHLEDDILLSFDSFLYFIHFRRKLEGYGLIPSFQRIEYNNADNHLYILDQIGISDFEARPHVNTDGYTFVNLDYPHVAMFILDRKLAAEYVACSSFDRELSLAIRPDWGLCERASMGLCFENIPEGFTNRYVSPVNPAKMTTPRWCWVYHVANNYVKNEMTPFGKTRTDHLFANDKVVDLWRPPSMFKKILSRVKSGKFFVPRSANLQ
jgi:hypothetical protein